MRDKLGFKDMFFVLKKRCALIILITMTAAASTAAVNYFLLTPVYQASVQILINGRQTSNFTDIQTNLELINTYNVIMKSPVILNKVKDDLNLQETTEELKKKITVASENESQIVSISATDKDYSKAAAIANTVASVFQRDIQDIMNDKAEISIVAKAVPYDSPAPVSPNKMFNMAVFTMFGLLLGAGLAFLLELLNSTVKNEEDIENGLELPILGNVLYTKPKKGQAVRLVNGVIGKDQSF
ncbi:Wzz/FepE/Etk N-terminal domain-containing protein [Bacillus sonorensis]|uniref:Transmembrane modulator TkmA n=2 Tax=Bacillus sonorensis TaxID=119858 RepID=M5PD33_9BACI|nr:MULTISPECIES: Wzz/FepE/Etk N-terminal domain-containing protein [Bacillus]TWK80618.1 putative capsular polysaccharide biosynthesis protein YwqC [Bacillus paralicheniformis]EME73422.1 transmembrane modulator TkmA [Bacillus sonorensis L12]MBG9914402.1 capsular biosynthesis protein [Bacillus sonorensis]MCF7616344.1 Wzz/FepE/Etk N-terminal domain-containing protein [Bacillus sonorensis]MCY7857730.1 Wzz/FepE/Etk N-terminal domain-containing protein [Bacillus sonorensis]